MSLKHINAGVLNIAYRDEGEANGPSVFLMHGFPYDVHAYDEVAPPLIAAGCRVITPYLRGYGPTRFLSANTLRSGEQAALGHDLLSLIDALEIPNAIVSGYDWGGRAACIVAALWPERVNGLVSCNGYNIQHIASAMQPQKPATEYRFWYQYYFHNERGRAGLAEHRYDFAKLLWRLWSPNWDFDEETYARTASAFENPDFVDVVIHSYRHRYGLADGDPAYQEIEQRLAAQPNITVPTVVLDGEGNGVMPEGGSEHHKRFFIHERYQYHSIPLVGHNIPQEAPTEFSQAILSLLP